MTLILAISTNEGIIMASDGQVTAGLIRSTSAKIFRLNSRCLWAASGELALIQRVEERLRNLPENESLSQLRDRIGELVKQCLTELLRLDFRTQFLPQHPDHLLQLHPGDFVFAEALPAPCVLHILANGTPEWIINRPFATGSGDLFAYALLQKYRGEQLSLDKASLLAYKVIEEAISVGAYGLGPPIDVWKITNNGLHQMEEAEKAGLEDASRTLREAEVQLLLGEGAG
jgi:proteasome beta subunit